MTDIERARIIAMANAKANAWARESWTAVGSKSCAWDAL
jgi:hypothetical protein